MALEHSALLFHSLTHTHQRPARYRHHHLCCRIYLGVWEFVFFFMKFSGLHVCTFSTFYWNVLPLFSRWTSTQSIICLKIFNFYFRNAAQLGRSMAKGVGELKSMQRILKNYLGLTAYKKQRVHGLTMAQKAESYYVGTTGTKFYFRMKKYFFCQIVTINKIIVYMQ